MTNKLYSVYFHGTLGDTYGFQKREVMGASVQDVFAGLTSGLPDTFRDTILEGSWHIVLGETLEEELSPLDKYLSSELVTFPTEENELHVFPAIIGAGGKGIGQIIIGVVLIIIAIVITVFIPPAGPAVWGMAAATWGSLAVGLAVAGVLSIAGGIMAMLTKPPTMASFANGVGIDQRPSFIFNGVVNNTEQGVPVPLVYGKHLTGSTIISASLAVEQI